MKIYVLSFLDLQNYGFGTTDVTVSTNLKELNETMRKQYLDACEKHKIEDPFVHGNGHQFCEDAYAYVDQFYYWDIFEKEVPVLVRKVEADIGYREEYDNGEVRYFSGWSGQGHVYKDASAFEKKEGVAYIREATFEHAKEDYDRDYVTLEQIENEDDCCTYESMMNEVWWYFKGDEAVDGKPWAEKFYEHVCVYIFETIDWQGFDVLLNEVDWDDDIEEFAED